MLKAGLGLSLVLGEGAMAGFEAVAAVVCDLVSAGAFRTIAMAAADDVVENCCVLHLEV